MTPALVDGVEALDAAVTVLVTALGRQSLYAAVALVLALPAARLLRRAPGRVQAALWALVLLRLALPPDLAAPWSARSLLTEVPGDAVWAVRAPGFGPLLEAAPAVPPGHRPPGDGAARFPWALFLASGWLAGVAATAGRLARGRRRFDTHLRQAAPVRDPEVLARFATFRCRLGIERPVRLLAGSTGAPPFTVGVLRPAVHVPAALLAPEHRAGLDAALAHELAHVRARDDLRLRLRSVVQALFFFHPVAWWAAARHGDARELAADERVLASDCLSPRAYGRGFAAAVRLGSLHKGLVGAHAAPALGADRRRLFMRLERILDTTNARARRGRLALPTLLAAGLLVLPMAGDAPASPPEPRVRTASAPAGAPMAAPAAAAAPEPFVHPVPQARLTSTFGERWNPLTRSRAHHRGIDLAAPTGTPILAPAAGTVQVATERYAPAEHLGTVVVIDHGAGLETLYSHLDTLAVAPGQQVSAGQTLGTVGSTGDVTGSHLHFEVRDWGEIVDPGKYLDLGPAGGA